MTGWWRTRSTEAKAGVISAVLAALGIVGSAVGWGWDRLASAEPAASTPPPVATTATGTPTGPRTGDPATPAAGRYLTDVERIGGQVAPLPDEADPARYPHAIAADCPSNQTGDTSTQLTYELDRRYRTFTATVSGMADTEEPDDIGVRVSIRTEQVDGTFVTTQQAAFRGVVNQPGGRLEAKVKDADELLLVVECHRPGGVVVLSDARVHD